MKRMVLSMLVSAIFVVCMLAAAASGQESQPARAYRTTTRPLQGTTPEQAYQDSLAGTTLPMWEYNIKSPADGRNYKGWILGRKYGTPGPDAEGNTPIPTIIIPLRVELLSERGKLETFYDPTQANPDCLKKDKRSPMQLVWDSPLLNDAPMVWGNTDLGKTQYVDAQLRAEFWTLVQATALPWHNKFAKKLAAKQTVKVPKEYWTRSGKDCDDNASIDSDWFDNYVKYTLIPSVAGVGPTTLPVVLTYQVTSGAAAGYHSAYGQPAQIYAVAEFVNSDETDYPDIVALSHELAEVMNNPLTSNGAPSWGHIGQQPRCQGDFEVADNLAPVWNPPIALNGFTYHPQELSFISWFYRSTNWGVNKWYSSNDSLVVDAGEVCSKFGPLVVVEPNYGFVATEAMVTLSHFPSKTEVTIYFNGELLDKVTTDHGRAELFFLVPEATNGEKQIFATWDKGSAYAWFIVTSP